MDGLAVGGLDQGVAFRLDRDMGAVADLADILPQQRAQQGGLAGVGVGDEAEDDGHF